MLTAIVTIELKEAHRKMLTNNLFRGCYILETEKAEYEVRDCDYDTLQDYKEGDTTRATIQVYVLCDASDLNYRLSTEAGHDFDDNLVLDAIKIDDVEMSIGDKFIEAGEIESGSNEDLIAGIINYLNRKVA